MKTIIRTSLLFCILAFGLAGCRSKQAPTVEPTPAAEEVAPQWINVQIPVRLEVSQPVDFAVNGTAAMVRGKYIYMSFRLLGFEIAQAYADPNEFDIVIKPQKNWLQEPMGDRLKSRHLDFVTLQDAMLGNPKALEAVVPSSISVERTGTKTAPEFRFETKLKGMTVDVKISWDLEDARWNVERPATFSAPSAGSGYSKMTLKNATNLLGK